MKFSGVLWVDMENIVSIHCKQTCMKKVAVSHATTVWT